MISYAVLVRSFIVVFLMGMRGYAVKISTEIERLFCQDIIDIKNYTIITINRLYEDFICC